MKKKHLLFLTAFSFMIAAASAEIPGTTQLLLSYMENDSELKELLISAKKAALSYDSTKIDNGFDISLTSGTITLKLGDDGTSLSAKPSATAKLPGFYNLYASLQSNVKYSDNVMIKR